MEGVTVPIYSFHCKECKKSFTLTMPLAEYEKGKFACPKCKSRKVEQRVAAFFAVSAKKS
jgi:putative FmdB family regulatory protein